MIGFNYANFKAALKRVEEEKLAELRKDIVQVKAFVEKALTLCFDCTASRARADYPCLEL